MHPGPLRRVSEDPLNHCRVLDAGNHPDHPSAGRTVSTVEFEHTFQPQHPAHRSPPPGGVLILTLAGSFRFVSPPPPAWRHGRAVLAVGDRDTVSAGEVDKGLRHHGGKSSLLNKTLGQLIERIYIFTETEDALIGSSDWK